MVRTSRQLKKLNSNQLDSLLTDADLQTTPLNQANLRELIALVPDTPRVELVQFGGNRKFKTEQEREEYDGKLSHMSDSQIDSLIRADREEPNWFTRKLYRRQGKFMSLSKGENTHELLHVVTKNVSIVMFVLMPFVAVLLLFFYFRRGRYYYDHLIFSVNIHTVIFLFFSIALAATYFTSSQVTSTVLAWMLWICWFYFLLSLKRVYQQSWGKTILKFFLLSVMYVMTAGVFLAIAFGAGFLTF